MELQQHRLQLDEGRRVLAEFVSPQKRKHNRDLGSDVEHHLSTVDVKTLEASGPPPNHDA